MSRMHVFETSQSYFDTIADHLGLDSCAATRLRTPEREFERQVTFALDDGQSRSVPTHRILHSDALGPTLGGLRWHTDAGSDGSRAMAAWTAWQCALFDLPLGGSCGAADCNPKELSLAERQRLARAYAEAYVDLLGTGLDTVVPDVYTTPQVMAWIADEVAIRSETPRLAAAAGKPLAIGGTLGQGDAIARGAVIAVRETVRRAELDPARLTFAIHGFGSLGRTAANLHTAILGGGRLLAACDSRGGVQAPEGLNVNALSTHKLQTGTVIGFPDSGTIASEELLALEVDVLYTAATPERISREEASSIRARVVCELSDAPLVPEADSAVNAETTILIPDILATGGRVVVAHSELVQNAMNDRWSAEYIHARLDTAIEKAVREVAETAESFEVDPRMAAWMVGIERVAEACHARGRC